MHYLEIMRYGLLIGKGMKNDIRGGNDGKYHKI